MAMNLRLDDELNEGLRARAQADDTSMQEVAKTAIRQYLSQRSVRLSSAITRVATEDAELLDRLGR